MAAMMTAFFYISLFFLFIYDESFLFFGQVALVKYDKSDRKRLGMAVFWICDAQLSTCFYALLYGIFF